MFGRLTFFVLGGVTVLVAKDPLRNAFKKTIIGAIKASDSLKEMVSEVAAEAREDMADAKAKAAAGPSATHA